MKFVMNRSTVVTSLSGHSTAFKKGVPTYVPREARKDVIAAGGAPEDDEGQGEVKEVVKVEMTEEERAEMIGMALADMKQRNERDDFTATGSPKVKAVEAAVGFDVTAAEVGALWTAMNQAGAAA